MEIKNLYTGIPNLLPREIIEVLLEAKDLRLERIVSHGQATAAGEWYDQGNHEWVMLLKGSAGIRFAGEAEIRGLRPGDALLIPAHLRHRVEWTEGGADTIWLALHYGFEV